MLCTYIQYIILIGKLDTDETIQLLLMVIIHLPLAITTAPSI